MKKLVASGVAALSIATGSLAVAVLNPLGAASAQTGSTGATTAATTRGGALKSVLDGFVADGTITQAEIGLQHQGVLGLGVQAGERGRQEQRQDLWFHCMILRKTKSS